MNIPFNKPVITGKELNNIKKVFKEFRFSGNGKYTKECHDFFEKKFIKSKVLLTTSCSDALEMSALLSNINKGDEVIMPSYTFTSTANAFLLQGAKIIFVDSRNDHPGVDEDQIEKAITDKTKAIVIVHYAGVACDMEKIKSFCNKKKIFLIEDAAQSINSFYINKKNKKIPLGTIGDIGCFSFHETKNLQCGEGGLICINNNNLKNRAEILWEKGTNRSSFFRGEINKYGWVDIGSSFLPSELNASFLKAQLDNLKTIQNKRLKIWNKYHIELKDSCERLNIKQPNIPNYATNNAHLYYLIFQNIEDRTNFISYMSNLGIQCVFHYSSLHNFKLNSNYEFKPLNKKLKNSDFYSECLVRLPLFYSLKEVEIDYIIKAINNYKM